MTKTDLKKYLNGHPSVRFINNNTKIYCIISKIENNIVYFNTFSKDFKYKSVLCANTLESVKELALTTNEYLVTDHKAQKIRLLFLK
jgi:hypothetical protein